MDRTTKTQRKPSIQDKKVDPIPEANEMPNDTDIDIDTLDESKTVRRRRKWSSVLKPNNWIDLARCNRIFKEVDSFNDNPQLLRRRGVKVFADLRLGQINGKVAFGLSSWYSKELSRWFYGFVDELVIDVDVKVITVSKNWVSQKCQGEFEYDKILRSML